jgi:hypothetical protein
MVGGRAMLAPFNLFKEELPLLCTGLRFERSKLIVDYVPC